MSDDEARDKLVKDSGGRPVKEPWLIRIKAGRRLQAWNKNVVAFGLASGFVEPLESTSIHMIMTACMRLAYFFPFAGVKPAMVERYNELSRYEIERIRDFVCMHYKYTEREDTAFWRHCREIEPPESLRKRVELFQQAGYIYVADNELMTIDSWASVMMGQRIAPTTYHHYARVNDKDLKEQMARHRAKVAEIVNALPAHADFVRQYAGASADAWKL
jgi:tryptophan halogenase